MTRCNMENKINWERKDYWNDYYIYDEYFLSFNLDHVGIKESWKELLEKWKLSTRIIIDYDGDECISVHNDDYSIVITRVFYYMIMTFSKNVDMSDCIRFLKDFMSTLDHYDGLTVRNGITGEYTIHQKEIIKIMIDKL